MTSIQLNWLCVLAFLMILTLLMPSTQAIQCFSGSQLQIIECSSVSCIKQSMGLDTVRYCDGAGASSICQTYGLVDMCQNLPNMGHICCCSDQLCNSASSLSGVFVMSASIFVLFLRFLLQ